MVIRKQTAPDPSRWMSSASNAVPIVMRLGRSPTRRSTRPTSGARSPASVMIPKNRIAKTNMPVTGAIFATPAVI